MASTSEWVRGARPRTLYAAVSPVAAGTGAAAAATGQPHWGLALLALLVALSLQVGVNYANDYSDGIRGTDQVRVGPVRLVGQGLAQPADVKLAAILCLFLASLTGLALVALSEAWILLPIGAGCLWAAWRYTGGDNPYGYRGWGEVVVFVCFGLVATLGTQLTQARHVTWPGLFAAVGVGALASAILVANNLRDLAGDAAHGKRTLAVRLGDAGTRRLYQLLLALAFLMVPLCALWHPTALVALAALLLAGPPLSLLRSGASGPILVRLLAGTGILQLGYAVLLGFGLGGATLL